MRDYPTKTFQTNRGRQWLATVSSPDVDRMELDMLLAQWKLWDEQLAQVDEQIIARVQQTESGQIMSKPQLLMTAPGVSFFSALTIVCHGDSLERQLGTRSNRLVASVFVSVEAKTPVCWFSLTSPVDFGRWVACSSHEDVALIETNQAHGAVAQRTVSCRRVALDASP
jgi:hypothetical protein